MTMLWVLSIGIVSAVAAEAALPAAAGRTTCPVVRLGSAEVDAAISNVADDVGAVAFRAGAGFIEAIVFVRCGTLADLAVPEEALCVDGDELSADAVGVPSQSAPPTPSATASPPT